MDSRRDFMKKSSAAAAAAMIGAHRGAVGAPVSTARPNIILILADDMGFSDIGCFGSEIATPNLDMLADRGMRINQFYNNPRCCPSRASIMTGLYPHQAGLGMMVSDRGRYPFAAYAGELSAQTRTIPETLQSVGYKTAMVGKWHLAPIDPALGKPNWPLQRGFDKFWGMVAGASRYFQSKALVHDNDPLPEQPADVYLTDAFGDHAVGYIKELSKGKDPYFLYAAFNAPHWPIQAPEAAIQKYADRYASGWDKLREDRHAKQLKMGLVDPRWALTARDPRVPAWTSAGHKKWEIRRMAVYAAMIEQLDVNVGRIVDAVEKSGQSDNTLIVFMSDNGGNAEEMAPENKPGPEGVLRGNIPELMPGSEKTFQSIGIPWGNCANTPFRLYKHYAHEGGISSPFIACWPKGIRAKGIVNAVGHETDLMPTFLELSGAKYPASTAAGPLPALVGESLTPLFEGHTRSRGTIFWEHEGNKAVRDGKWKLVSRFPDGWELHDMEADRTEVNDLSDQQPERVKAMAQMYDKWAKMVGVQPWPMPQTPPEEREPGSRTPAYLKEG